MVGVAGDEGAEGVLLSVAVTPVEQESKSAVEVTGQEGEEGQVADGVLASIKNATLAILTGSLPLPPSK